MNSLPPEFSTSIFNSLAFGTTGNLTKAQADRLYLSIAEGQNLGLIASITPGIASASKALIVDSSRNISNIGTLTANKNIANQNDTSNSTVAYPLEVTHSLSSGSPSVNNFGSGLLLNGPNASNNIISYARMYSVAQSTTTNLHQGNLTMSTVFAGNFVDTLRLSCLTSANNTLVQALGSNSTISAVNLTGTLTTSAQPSITSVGTLTSLTVSGDISCTNLTGTLATAAQSNVTSLGTLTGLTNSSHYNVSAQNIPTGPNSTRSISLNDHAIFFRASSGSDNKHGLMYAGYLNPSWNTSKGWGNGVYPMPSVGLDGPVLYGNGAVAIGNFTGNSQVTCAAFVNKTASFNEKINIATRTDSHALTVNQSSGNCLRLIKNDSSTSDFEINVGDNGSTTLQPTNGLLSTSFALTLVSSNTYLKTGYDESNPFYAIDIRGRRWGLDARMDSDSLVISSGSDFKFYSNPTAGILAAVPAASISSGGLLTTENSVRSKRGLRSEGVDVSSYVGPGVSIHYGASKGSILSYDYTLGQYKDLEFNNTNLYIQSATGYVGVGTSSPSAPLSVVNAAALSNPGAYGWVNSGGAGNAVGFTNRLFTIVSSGSVLLSSGELNVLSDTRIKKDIQSLGEDEALRLLDVEPISFKYKSQADEDPKIYHGYRAQDLIKQGLRSAVAVMSIDESEPELDETSTIVCHDGSKLELGKRDKLVASKTELIPLLHVLIKRCDKKINEQAKQIAELHKLLEQKSDKRVKKKDD